MAVNGPVTPGPSENDPPIDADKVATLKAAIASGDYLIDCDGLAGAMICFGCSDESNI